MANIKTGYEIATEKGYRLKVKINKFTPRHYYIGLYWRRGKVEYYILHRYIEGLTRALWTAARIYLDARRYCPEVPE